MQRRFGALPPNDATRQITTGHTATVAGSAPPSLRISILGPLRVTAGSTDIAVGGIRSQAVLAALLLGAGRVVSVPQLVDSAWGENPPGGAHTQVRNRVSTLRRLLRDAEPSARPIATSGSGYRMEVERASVDLFRFDDGVAQAKKLWAAGDLANASAALAAVLKLWRGPALDGLTTPCLHLMAERIEERRRSALEDRIRIDLDLGLNTEVVAELTELISADPYREARHALLMLALYRSGRQADALDAFRRARTLLVEHLGVEPGPQLQRLHQALLRGDAEILRAPRSATTVPAVESAAPPRAHELPADSSPPVGRPGPDEASPACWLPRAIPDFTGRRDIVARLVGTTPHSEPAGPVVHTIDGMAGSGKTTLAVHVAGLLAARYPDAQLFIDLNGHREDAATEPTEALATLLRQLGVPAARIPVDLDGRSVLWRHQLAARRAVVVLDNVASSRQVAPLLPSAPGALVLVTSRCRLVGFDGPPPESLPLLSEDEGVELLARVVGASRVRAEPGPAAAVVRRCGHLPLAIRLAGARLAHRPRWRVADLEQRLGRGRPGLCELAVENRSLTEAFALSYEPLPQPVKRMFRLLGHYPGEFVGAGVAALSGLPLPQAEAAIEHLVDRHLVEEVAVGRFRLHGLIREYARQLAAADPSTNRGYLPRPFPARRRARDRAPRTDVSRCHGDGS
ncbi:AfsR/SARP family transcriptional regulator [Micromonospora coxensis]|uniref:AfsR/SARP family transcriptional regulator n=1 Tax=Micromonospora coxensis TaxID=356852 RepID=UPI0034273BAE